MIGNKHIISNTSRAVGIGLMATEIEALIYDLRWLIALSFALIIADFWLGISVKILTTYMQQIMVA